MPLYSTKLAFCMGMPPVPSGILVPLPLAHHDFSLGASESCISSCKKLRLSNSFSASSRSQRLSVRRRATHAIKAMIMANPTIAQAVKTPITAVLLEKKSFVPGFECVRAGLLMREVTVMKEDPSWVR